MRGTNTDPPRKRIRGLQPAERVARADVPQRVELTFKHNQGLGRHGLLRLTPAYSLRLVEELLTHDPPRVGLLDPFCGTGTTPLVGAARGVQSFATDVNPFLVWFAGVKTRLCSSAQLARIQAPARALVLALPGDGPLADVPPLHQIERWWSAQALFALQRIRGEIDARARRRGWLRDALELALCRALIRVSNAAFNHPSMSFRAATEEAGSRLAVYDVFGAELTEVLQALGDSPRVSATILESDARSLRGIEAGSFDRVVTSPPYANRMSYVRELRPYMYWLGHLRQAREAGELDWQAIGGTWGVATSRLTHWQAGDAFRPQSLQRALRAIRKSEAKNAEILARYVERYFEDAWGHLVRCVELIHKPGSVDYIVGNSTFYGVIVPTERIYAEMLRELHAVDVRVVMLRKRNSKKELYEYRVTGRF
ncbi:MAG: DNA methyltransferase [Polyangiaceae bacterium]